MSLSSCLFLGIFLFFLAHALPTRHTNLVSVRRLDAAKHTLSAVLKKTLESSTER